MLAGCHIESPVDRLAHLRALRHSAKCADTADRFRIALDPERGALGMNATTRPGHPHQVELRGWLETLTATGTRQQYRRHVEAVLTAGGGRLAVEGFEAHRDAEYERGLSLSSIRVLTAATRKFARYLNDRGLMSSAELSAFWDAPRLEFGLPPAPVEVNDGFVGRMAAAAKRAGDGSTLRISTDRAVLVLLSGCGLPDDEAVALQWQDYDSGSAANKCGATISVRRPFGIAQHRTIEVPAKGRRILDHLHTLHRRLVVGQVDTAPILAGLFDDGSSPAGLVQPFRTPTVLMLKRTVDRLAQRAGAKEGTVCPSDLRRIYEARLRRADAYRHRPSG